MKLSAGAGFAMGAAFSLILAGGTAYAATGGTFIIGHANAASTTTTLSNSAGTPLSLGARAGFPALAVNTTNKVVHLNSDLLDGIDSTQFLRSTGRAVNADRLDNLDSSAFALAAGYVGTWYGSGVRVDFDGDGILDSIEADALCPAGTFVVGGGFINHTTGPVSFSVAYDDGTGWAAVVPDANSSLNPQQLYAQANCYNPRGSVPVQSPAARTHPMAKLAAR